MKTIKKDRLKILLCTGIQRAAAKLHMGPSTLATMSFEIRDENGNLEKRIEQKSNSFVRNYYNYLSYFALFKSLGNTVDTGAGAFGDGADTPMKDTSGALKTASSTVGSSGFTLGTGNAYLNISAAISATAGNTTKGIVVGTSDSAESFDSYSLGAQIPHGTTLGKLSYGAENAVGSSSFDSVTKKLTTSHSRSFSNSSGETVTIKEIGFLVTYVVQSSAFYALLIRDVLASPIDLPSGKTLTVVYDLSLVMSN